MSDGWTPRDVAATIAVFGLAGLCEIGGGWLVWQAVREGKPWWWAIAGGLVLVAYGFAPTLSPIVDFARLYAVYGGFFIMLSYAWGWGVDGMRPDKGDIIGSSIAIGGVLVALFWPRGDDGALDAERSVELDLGGRL